MVWTDGSFSSSGGTTPSSSCTLSRLALRAGDHASPRAFDFADHAMSHAPHVHVVATVTQSRTELSAAALPHRRFRRPCHLPNQAGPEPRRAAPPGHALLETSTGAATAFITARPPPGLPQPSSSTASRTRTPRSTCTAAGARPSAPWPTPWPSTERGTAMWCRRRGCCCGTRGGALCAGGPRGWCKSRRKKSGSRRTVQRRFGTSRGEECCWCPGGGAPLPLHGSVVSAGTSSPMLCSTAACALLCLCSQRRLVQLSGGVVSSGGGRAMPCEGVGDVSMAAQCVDGQKKQERRGGRCFTGLRQM